MTPEYRIIFVDAVATVLLGEILTEWGKKGWRTHTVMPGNDKIRVLLERESK